LSLPVTRRIPVSVARPPADDDLTGGAITVRPGPDGAGLSPQQYTDDGRLVVVRTPLPRPGGRSPVGLGQQEIGLLHAGAFRVLARATREDRGPLRGRMRQITAIGAGDGHLVWVETPSTDLVHHEWVLRGCRIGSCVVRTLARSAPLTGDSRLVDVFGGNRPVVLAGHVYWATAVPLVRRPDPGSAAHWSFDVQRVRLDGRGRATTVARDAVLPTAADGALFYVTKGTAGGDGVPWYRIHRRQAGTGTDQVVVTGPMRGEARITGLVAGSGWLAWTVSSERVGDQGWDPGTSRPGHVYLMDPATDRVVEVTTADNTGLNGSLALGPGRLLWGNGSGNGDPGQYLVDLDRFTLWRLGENRGASLVLTDPRSPRVLWATDCGSGAGTCWREGHWRRRNG
jgi:hypothetical protein